MTKKVVLGITGGIAVYKVCTLVRLLRRSNIEVDVIMTDSATKFVSPLTFETLSNRPVVTSMFDRPGQWEVGHISYAQKGDLMVIAPATANIIAKATHGIADDMLSTTLLAATSPIIMCPAMNTNMYNNVATQNNIALLIERGVTMIDATAGELACGDSGKGRMAEPEDIYNAIMARLYPKQDLVGKKVLVTLGATQCQLDDVRVITNHSTGRMGNALVAECLARGAEVTVVAGTNNINIDNRAKVINVLSTNQMHEAVMANVDVDVAIMAAAPCDYVPKQKSATKIKGDNVTLELVKNVDIASSVGHLENKPKLVIFSAETDNGIENAKKKLTAKNADIAVLNIVKNGAVFGSDYNKATIIDCSKPTELDSMTKDSLAEIIIDRVAQIL